MDIHAEPLAAVPPPAAKRIALRVSRPAERALRGGHPWLYAAAISRQSHEGAPGDLAVIFDGKGRFLAVGLYDPESHIRVRVLQHGRPAPIDSSWFAARIAEASKLRDPLRAAGTTAYRLVHGEHDGLPGLVVDRYDQTTVLKLYSAAWIAHLRPMLDALAAETGGERFILRLSRRLQQQSRHLYGLANGTLLSGPPLAGPVPFVENGLVFTCDPIRGQKTGFFLDQRDNRARVETLVDGRSVLNVFAYTGGFSLYAARGGAGEVVSLDLSRPALAAARRHFQLNNELPQVAAAQHETLQGDAFELLPQLARDGRRFDLVILDPPAFAHRAADAPKALHAYEHLARLGLGVLNRGGILVAASCSRPIPADDFFRAVHSAAADQKRPLTELARTGHPLDHPVRFAEGAYLKCLYAAVD